MNQLDNHPTKIPYSNPKMNRWKSWRANTQFAPNFDIPIYTDQYEESLALRIAKQISDNDVGMSSDVANALNTTYQRQWSMYNIFDWQTEEIKQLASNIYDSYSSFMKSLNANPLPKDKLWIRGWAVVLTDGENLEQHCHASVSYTHLRAH